MTSGKGKICRLKAIFGCVRSPITAATCKKKKQRRNRRTLLQNKTTIPHWFQEKKGNNKLFFPRCRTDCFRSHWLVRENSGKKQSFTRLLPPCPLRAHMRKREGWRSEMEVRDRCSSIFLYPNTGIIFADYLDFKFCLFLAYTLIWWRFRRKRGFLEEIHPGVEKREKEPRDKKATERIRKSNMGGKRKKTPSKRFSPKENEKTDFYSLLSLQLCRARNISYATHSSLELLLLPFH